MRLFRKASYVAMLSKKTLFLQAIPFILFAVGYVGMAWLLPRATNIVPVVTGLSLDRAAQELAAVGLGLRVVGYQDRLDVAPGSIITQIPHAGQTVRAQQLVHLVCARAPQPNLVPACVGLSLEECKNLLAAEDLRIHSMYVVASRAPRDICIAQYPEPGSERVEGGITLIISAPPETLRIMPDFRGAAVESVREICEMYGITLVVSGLEHEPVQEHGSRAVIEQRPLPGSFINTARAVTVFVQV